MDCVTWRQDWRMKGGETCVSRRIQRVDVPRRFQPPHPHQRTPLRPGPRDVSLVRVRPDEFVEMTYREDNPALEKCGLRVPIVTFPICLTGTIAFGEEFGEFVEIFLDCDAQGALMQRGGWMVHRDNQAMPDFL